jgi:hypothetical protein
MKIEAIPNSSALTARGTDKLQPFLRPAGDGTYEVVVPLTDCISPLVLPYSFPSEEDGRLWIKSRKGSERIRRARTRFE